MSYDSWGLQPHVYCYSGFSLWHKLCQSCLGSTCSCPSTMAGIILAGGKVVERVCLFLLLVCFLDVVGVTLCKKRMPTNATSCWSPTSYPSRRSCSHARKLRPHSMVWALRARTASDPLSDHTSASAPVVRCLCPSRLRHKLYHLEKEEEESKRWAQTAEKMVGSIGHFAFRS